MNPSISRTARRSTRPLLAALAVLIGILSAASTATAQQLHPPRVGQNYFTAGATLQPGFFYDRTTPAGDAWATVMPTGGSMARLGFHHVIGEQFTMAAEVDAGMLWFNEHTAERTGRADSQWAFAWQLNLMGRWLPFGVDYGWSLGVGPHLNHAYLEDQSLQALGFRAEAGRYLWSSEDNFLFIGFGYDIPFIQGLSGPSGYTTSGREERVEKDWTLHRFNLNIQYGF